MTLILLVCAAILLVTVVSGAYLFVFGCVRRKELPWLVEEEIRKTPYKKFSKHIQAANQWLSEHAAEDVWITSHDGLKLHALWVPAQNPKGTMLLAHGYRSCLLLDFGMALEFYHERGLNLLIPDQRAHGKSEGRYITFGVKESRDMRNWIAFHNEHFGTIPMLLSGLSMGASTVLYLADKRLPDNVRGLIADCGFTSPKDILSCVFRSVTHLPALPSIIIAEICARCFAGFSFWECDTRRSLSAARIPVLMIHGKEDGFVPCDMSRQGYEACTGEKQLLIVEGADHAVSYLVDPDRYKALVNSFIDKNLN